MQPLDKSTRARILKNWETLTRLMEPDSGLVCKLFAARYISERQRQFIDGQQFATRKNEKLLDIFLRKSLAEFDGLLECLEETKQRHVADIFRGTAGNMLVFSLLFLLRENVFLR